MLMATSIEPESILFPYDSIRREQSDMIKKVIEAVEKQKHALIHAPTGLGKTAATLAPVLSHVLKKAQETKIKEDIPTIFFLTSRHTQHKIAIDTLRQIKEKYQLDFDVVDIIGKKWMCLQSGVSLLGSSEFSEYCKSVREDKTCEFYTNTRENAIKFTPHGQNVISKIKNILPAHVEALMEYCKDDEVCPYEITAGLAPNARVVIADYYYIFHPNVRERFFAKTGKELSKAIVIVDEAHNLPKRIQSLMSSSLTSNMIKYAIKEAKKYDYSEVIPKLIAIQDILVGYSTGLSYQFPDKREKLISKHHFLNQVTAKTGQEYDELIDELEVIGDAIRIGQKTSLIGNLAKFLENWKGEDEGFVRILGIVQGKGGEQLRLSYRCLDPSLVAGAIISESYSTIMMSGTLSPTNMYYDLLGFPDNTMECEFDNPFHENNRLALVIPKTTTKFSQRTEEQFAAIGEICKHIIDTVPGNTAIFFPSYQLRDNVYQYVFDKTKKTCFVEHSGMSKQEKADFIDRFSQYKESGAVLLGAVTGSFGEGIDLPGDLLKCVVIVGLPLQTPNLETKELIAYYDKKFNRGWDYGYILPAFQKTLQGAGRCIRTEKDRGVVVFLDERYAWPRYARCFPGEYAVKIVEHPIDEIEEFFGK